MNKKKVKKILITLSSLYIMVELFLEGPIKKIVYTANEPIKHIPFIIAIIILIIAILLKIDNKKEINNMKKYKIKNMLFMIIGISLFIGIILYNLFLTLNISSVITINEFIANLKFISFFVWPLYIIGTILIIMSFKNIIKLKKQESR